MPLLLTLTDAEGGGPILVMLPPDGRNASAFKITIVGSGDSVPYLEREATVHAEGRYFALTLERTYCCAYRR